MIAADLAFAPIHTQAQLIAAGEVSARELLDVYLERIDRLDPHLNAMRVVLTAQARAQADQADARRRAGDSRPLLGIPFAVKDEMDLAGEVTAVGTRAFGQPARADGEFVARLRAAGAVIVAKTNVPELCIWPFTESATWGITRNPWDLTRTPGGSSGGSAAAVAAGLVGAALASDGGGSIRIPAAYCGLFGLKCQRGRIPPDSERDQRVGLTVYGALTRTVLDTALFLDAIGHSDLPGGPPPPSQPWVQTLQEEPRPLRIALSTAVGPGVLAHRDPEPLVALNDTAALLRSLGHEVVDADPQLGQDDVPAFVVRYLAAIHEGAEQMANPQLLERRTRAMARAGGLIGARTLRWARERESQVSARLLALFDDYDVLMTPVTTTPPPPVGRYEGRGWLWTMNGVARVIPHCPRWNMVGQPACSVPAGWDASGLPRAVQFVARPNDEATLLSLAAQIEQARPWIQRRPPLAQ